MPEFNTHSKSPAWEPLKELFRRERDQFIAAHRDERFTEKHHIGAAMWKWLCEKGLVDPDLRSHAEGIHFRPTKEKGGLPLWRLVFKDTLRNTPEIDALFIGKRRGPTPRYARLAEAGLVPRNPADFVPETPSVDSPVVQPRVDRYQAQNEVAVHPDGSEWVYVYTTKRELDNLRDHNVQPMVKVGQTRNHYTARIASQVRQTAALSPYLCLYAYRVRDAQQLESAVHKVLKVQGRHVPDAVGIEWFEAEPQHVHQVIMMVTGRPLS